MPNSCADTKQPFDSNASLSSSFSRIRSSTLTSSIRTGNRACGKNNYKLPRVEVARDYLGASWAGTAHDPAIRNSHQHMFQHQLTCEAPSPGRGSSRRSWLHAGPTSLVAPVTDTRNTNCGAHSPERRLEAPTASRKSACHRACHPDRTRCVVHTFAINGHVWYRPRGSWRPLV